MSIAGPCLLILAAIVAAVLTCVVLYRLIGIKKTAVAMSVVVLVPLVWFTWQSQPWTPTGRAVYLSSTHLGDHDFQIWQRKNADLGEPFATGLFVRKQGGQWNAFLLDFEDTFRPTISLRREGSKITIFYGRTKWGYFDEGQGVLMRESNDTAFLIDGVPIYSDPPGNWRLKASRP